MSTSIFGGVVRVRSIMPHARVVGMDVAEARTMPGVCAIREAGR